MRAVYKKQFCQFAPPAWADCRGDVFYFPEYLISDASKAEKKKFSSEVWTGLNIATPNTIMYVSENIKLTIEQYLSGQRTNLGIKVNAALKDKMSRLRAIRDREPQEPQGERPAAASSSEEPMSTTTSQRWGAREGWSSWRPWTSTSEVVVSPNAGWYDRQPSGSSSRGSQEEDDRPPWRQRQWSWWDSQQG